jgi:hypothetical protein
MANALPPPPPPRSGEALQYTHSGGRFLLGYGEGYFGIWDRTRAETPVERFDRTEEGWRAAWRRYVALEPAHTEVGLGEVPTSSPAGPASGGLVRPSAYPGTRAGAHPSVRSSPIEPYPRPPRASAGRPAHPAWWLLPILMGWMGGLLAWLLIRDQDRTRARAMLIAGIVSTVAWIVIYSALVPAPS